MTVGLTVEPIKHTQTARFRSLQMYRPELDQLIAFFQNSCASVVISDNQHRYNSLDEMKANIGVRIRDLDIRGEKPGVHFLLNQKEYPPGSATPAIFNELRTEEITDEAEALFLRVKNFLESRQRPTNTRFMVPALLSLFAAFILLAISLHQGQRSLVTLSIVMCFVLVIVLTSFAAYNQNYIILETKLNSPSFFVRNREEFARHAVTASISGVVGLFFGWLLGHFLK